MAKFREIHSGLVYEFLSAYDLIQMRAHPDYEEIVVEYAKKEESESKKPGRPALSQKVEQTKGE